MVSANDDDSGARMKAPIYLIAGARPNFIKLAPLVKALRTRGTVPFKIVHTGQHYDATMSRSFFDVLGIPDPDFNLEVGSGTHGVQTARIIERFEQLLTQQRPAAIVVFGDVNSTLACSVAAAKLLVPIVHVEAGLRSFDRTMPEEINRIVTDSLSALLFVTEQSGLENLQREGVAADRIRFVGNIMIDSLEAMMPIAMQQNLKVKYHLNGAPYALVTMHRPSNVDSPETLLRVLMTLNTIADRIGVFFPVHPRTREKMKSLHFTPHEKLRLMEPVDYLDSLALQRHAKMILSDSGGMQEEAAHLGVPCLTMRENTERPVTIERGTSTLVGNDPQRIMRGVDAILSGEYKRGSKIPLWDGKSAGRIANELETLYRSL
jgi:UDP-N-acetylglucosamine 2-epimerase (non-hydrolysing)